MENSIQAVRADGIVYYVTKCIKAKRRILWVKLPVNSIANKTLFLCLGVSCFNAADPVSHITFSTSLCWVLIFMVRWSQVSVLGMADQDRPPPSFVKTTKFVFYGHGPHSSALSIYLVVSVYNLCSQ